MDQLIYEDAGFGKVYQNELWQVAFKNYAPVNRLEAVEKIEIHHLTDELYILQEGDFVLVEQTGEANGQRQFTCSKLAKGVVYSMPQNTWHTAIMSEGSSCILVEKANTCLDNSEVATLSAAEILSIQEMVKQVLA